MKPNINIHNYEEYFLLYADGELSVEEMGVVESFLTEHPELKSSFDALLQTKLNSNDEIIFEQKKLLFQKNDVAISENNYEEYFLLYVDGELNGEQKTEVEKFVLQHPVLQNEFTLLKQTQLVNEPVVFADKESLFKKATVTKPIISIYLKRFAVAASVIGLLLTVWYFYAENKNVVQQSAVAEKTKSMPLNNPDQVKVNELNSGKFKSNPAEIQTQKHVAVFTHRADKNVIAKTVSAINTDSASNKITDETNFVLADNTKTNNRELVAVEPTEKIHAVRQVEQITDKNLNNGLPLNDAAKETNNQTDNKNEVLYVANLKIKKNKIPNILKRAQAFLHFNGNDDNSIAIANFSISK